MSEERSHNSSAELTPEPGPRLPSRRQLAIIAGGAAIVVLATVFVTLASSRGSGALVRFPSPTNSVGFVAAVQLDARGKRVASGLYCACGCPDLLLACDCGNRAGATEIKQMINDLLRGGRSEEDVRIELINKYGTAIQRRGR